MIIKNNNFLFRPLEENDLPYMVKWRNDPLINRFTASFKPISLEDELKWFNKIKNDITINVYLSYDHAKDKPIGYAILKNIDVIKNELEVGCYICEHEYLNKGVSFVVAASFLDYLFIKKGFEKAYMFIHENHKIGIRAGEFMSAVFEGYSDKSIFNDARTTIYTFYRNNYLKRKEEFMKNMHFYNKLYKSLTYLEP